MSPGRKTAREFLAEFSEVASISRWVDGPVVELKGEATWRYFKGPAIAILEEACRAYGIRVIDKPEQTGGFGVVIASTRPGE